MKRRGRGARGESVAGRGNRGGATRGKRTGTGATSDRLPSVQRRTSARNATRRGVFAPFSGNRMDDLRDRYTNRRNLIFKANCPSKSPQARAQMRFLEHVWHNDIRYTIGDIVGITDKEDNLQYFAQIRGLMVNPMMESFAALTWLIPKKSAPNPHKFDAEQFAHGLLDADNYSLKICEWIAGRPQLPSYKKNWTPERAATAVMRANLETKWEQLQRVAKEELLRINLLNLADSKNEEGVQHLHL